MSKVKDQFKDHPEKHLLISLSIYCRSNIQPIKLMLQTAYGPKSKSNRLKTSWLYLQFHTLHSINAKGTPNRTDVPATFRKWEGLRQLVQSNAEGPHCLPSSTLSSLGCIQHFSGSINSSTDLCRLLHSQQISVLLWSFSH